MSGEVKGYKCPNCGSMMRIPRSGNIFKCDCCESEFERENDYLKPLKIEVCHARLVTLSAKSEIQDDYLQDENIKEKVIEHTIKGIARELADSIVPFMEIESYKDLATRTTIIAGRVSVAEKSIN